VCRRGQLEPEAWTPVSTNVLIGPVMAITVPATQAAEFYRAAVVP